MKSTPDKFRNIRLKKFNPNEKFVSFREYLILDKAGNYSIVTYQKDKFIANYILLEVERHEIDFITSLK